MRTETTSTTSHLLSWLYSLGSEPEENTPTVACPVVASEQTAEKTTALPIVARVSVAQATRLRLRLPATGEFPQLTPQAYSMHVTIYLLKFQSFRRYVRVLLRIVLGPCIIILLYPTPIECCLLSLNHRNPLSF
jgi:hypothetical protein